jgi:hypothetical protein
MREAIERVMGAPNYPRYPDRFKALALSKAIEQAREKVAQQARLDALRAAAKR